MPARASPSPPLITFQFHPLVVSLENEREGTYFNVEYTSHPALKGLNVFFYCAADECFLY